jgi:hypothetical protein
VPFQGPPCLGLRTVVKQLAAVRLQMSDLDSVLAQYCFVLVS